MATEPSVLGVVSRHPWWHAGIQNKKGSSVIVTRILVSGIDAAMRKSPSPLTDFQQFCSG